VHLTTKFRDPTFNRSEVIVLTNKQTPLKTSTSFRYATPVGKPNQVLFKIFFTADILYILYAVP